MKHLSFFLLFSSLLSCGGGGGGGGSSSSLSEENPTTDAVLRNVALNSNGASTTSTFDEANASSVIDGDITEAFFWSPNITGDSFIIDFGRVVALNDISIFTNDLSFSSASPSRLIEISEDRTTWLTTSLAVGGDVPCGMSVTGNGRMACIFSAPESIRFLRVTITSEDSPELIKIFEVMANGI